MSWDNRRKRDTNIMFAVTFEDGRTAYITISPKLLEPGDQCRAHRCSGAPGQG
jgi:hypothetical protein